MKFIEIKGVQFVNKGAELMLLAVIEQVKLRWPDASIVLQTGEASPYRSRALLGCYQKAALRFLGIEFNAYSQWLPRKLRYFLSQRYGIVTEADIDVVLDASGFAYGDQWPEENGLYLANELKRFHAAGKAYVFLPQAFGPFSRQNERNALSKALPLARLICARDQQSYEHLQKLASGQLTGTARSLWLYPDFTNLVAAQSPEHPVPHNCLTVIPNYQMLSKANANQLWPEGYLNVLRHFIRLAVEKGMPVLLLNHEGKNDLALCQQLVLDTIGQVEVRTEPDPLKVKALIGQSKLVVCSRFHGCVSALSQGIACLGTSWSHKYDALFSDYGVKHWLIDATATEVDRALLFEQVLSHEHTELLQRSAELKELSRSMWERVGQSLEQVVTTH